jgi:hypothetical protein
MFARRYFAPRYWPLRYWTKASSAPDVVNTVATPKLASHVDLPRPADTTSAFGRWADDLIRRLQRAFETIIYTLNAVSITDIRANRVDHDLLNGSFYTSTDVGITYVAHNDVWSPVSSLSGRIVTTAALTYTLTRLDSVLLVDATAGAVTVTVMEIEGMADLMSRRAQVGSPVGLDGVHAIKNGEGRPGMSLPHLAQDKFRNTDIEHLAVVIHHRTVEVIGIAEVEGTGGRGKERQMTMAVLQRR